MQTTPESTMTPRTVPRAKAPPASAEEGKDSSLTTKATVLLVEAVVAVKKAFSECPNLVSLTRALLDAPLYSLHKACQLVPGVPIAPMLATAQRQFGGAPIGRVYVFNPGDTGAVVVVYPSDAQSIGYMSGEVSFDGATGQMLKAWTEQRAGVRAYQTVYGLHMARFAPDVTRWLYLLAT